MLLIPGFRQDRQGKTRQDRQGKTRQDRQDKTDKTRQTRQDKTDKTRQTRQERNGTLNFKFKPKSNSNQNTGICTLSLSLSHNPEPDQGANHIPKSPNPHRDQILDSISLPSRSRAARAALTYHVRQSSIYSFQVILYQDPRGRQIQYQNQSSISLLIHS
jgi:hypothetical protein